MMVEPKPILKSDTCNRLRIREIAHADVTTVIDLLAKGFPNPRRFWDVGLGRLQTRSVPPDTPRYGYLLEADGRPVGALLVISSVRQRGDREVLFSNLSSWYVEAAFRMYAPLLHKRAIANERVTYLNLSAATHTQSTIEAYGFRRYSNGQVAALLALARNRQGGRVRIVDASGFGDCDLEEGERRLLLAQAAYGCITFCCAVRQRVRPFVFVPRLVRGSIPCAQLAYCRDIIDLVDVAGTVGRYLLRLGRPIVLIDAGGPIPGIPGKYFPEATPKYYRGTELPVLGDMAETEVTILGFE